MKMTIKKQLIIALLLVGIIPFVMMGVTSFNSTQETLDVASFSKLAAVRDIKVKQVEQLFHFRKADLETLAISSDVHRCISELIRVHKELKVKGNENYPVNHSKAKKVIDKYDNYFQKFQENYGYFDVFVVCAKHGHVMYSAAKESDFGENLSAGKLRDSGLGEVWSKVTKSGRPSLVDMAPYAPSNGEPAIFMGAPITQEGKMTAVLVIQISDKATTGITSGRAGMGETGEVYIVGEDKLMRCDSFLDSVNSSLKASFANLSTGSCNYDWVVDGPKGN